MILYHGSTISIDTIDLSQSRPNKDFGLAFYLSADKEQAEITFEQFLERIKYIKGITFQYAFCTQKAIGYLRKL